ncbi:KipI antagonist [Virgibacillus phasianinus]|uniref:KipI antagonist n=1 Tax=Virgibacillus phasianinus TaxID=2017483 RepID=A0A220U2V9_9BACI|nr:biotin-dependent carboxyltransferase family protein [Virgibacillus phasianinus]ASK62430.1 KipI antagonist [Virgibacillus phasianinus]
MLKIIKPGLLSTIQDLGRHGYQKFGVIASGVMDPLAHRIANLLVGNDEDAATLEITLAGPVILFEKDALISLCGGDLSPAIDGKSVRMWRTIFVKKGSKLQFGAHQSGCRTYLSIAGGFKVPEIMDSSSTYLRAEIGGFHGRALKADDRLETNLMTDLSKVIMEALIPDTDEPFGDIGWSITSSISPFLSGESTIQVIPGRQFHLFTKESKQNLFKESYDVSPQSDRMGYRLQGAKLSLSEPEDLISEAVAFGSIQVPPDGNPIVLLADRQTTGGYPKIGQIASVDMSLIAQAKPGDSLSFKKITVEAAQQLYLEQENNIQQLKQGIRLKFKSG